MIPNRKYKRQALRQFCYEKHVQQQEQSWICCDAYYDDKATLGRHIHSVHDQELLQRESQLAEADRQRQYEEQHSPLTKRRSGKGTSDPIHVQCDCDQSKHRVILFYQYVAVSDPDMVANMHINKCGQATWDLTGKVRVAKEGLNVTLAGTVTSISAYMNWYENELQQLLSPTACIGKPTNDFFKPSIGCRHVFGDQLSIKLVDEICPLRQPSVTLEQLTQQEHQQRKLSPSDFHTFATKAVSSMPLSQRGKEMILLDTRNYYESKIGHFKRSVTPSIRKFSVFPAYVDHHRDSLNGKAILTYCTGGIRCEKATAYLRQALSADTEIYMLDGGIHQYLNWVEQHPEVDPLWQGKNYVFDARQGMGLSSPSSSGAVIVSECQSCHQPWDTYQKCQSDHCHLLVLHCATCRHASGDVSFCCEECQFGKHLQRNGGNGICACERLRKAKELDPISPVPIPVKNEY